MYCFLSFDFINVTIFFINACGPYLGFVGAESCVKFVSVHLDQYVLTYGQLLTKFTKIVATILLFTLF